ncbi:MAG: glycosyltransferase [Saprospiraceae bacterium]
MSFLYFPIITFSFLISFLYYSFILSTLIQLAFWLFLFARLAFFKEKKIRNKKQHSLSIIIAARNEASNIKKNIIRILKQSYRSVETIVVNHNSSDESETILYGFQEKFPTFRIINYYNINSGKKNALSAGIRAARNPILLLTDADCQPASAQWAHDMQQLIDDKIEIVLGYGPYYFYPGLLNRLVRYETALTALQYFSYALAGIPYMGVGRNLMYKQSLFFKTDGFINHEHIASGDDDLFINAVARNDNVAICLRPSTFVYSEPERTWRDWYRQKSRHLTTGTHYRPLHQLLLGLFSLSHFFHYFLGLLLLVIAPQYTVTIILFYCVRLLTIWSLWKRILQRLHEPNLWLWIPFLDALWLLYYVIFTPVLFKRNTKNTSWK